MVPSDGKIHGGSFVFPWLPTQRHHSRTMVLTKDPVCLTDLLWCGHSELAYVTKRAVIKIMYYTHLYTGGVIFVQVIRSCSEDPYALPRISMPMLINHCIVGCNRGYYCKLKWSLGLSLCQVRYTYCSFYSYWAVKWKRKGRVKFCTSIILKGWILKKMVSKRNLPKDSHFQIASLIWGVQFGKYLVKEVLSATSPWDELGGRCRSSPRNFPEVSVANKLGGFTGNHFGHLCRLRNGNFAWWKAWKKETPDTKNVTPLADSGRYTIFLESRKNSHQKCL